jgi:hypothetical protein
MAAKLNAAPDADKNRPINIKEKKHREQTFQFASVEAAVVALANAHDSCPGCEKLRKVITPQFHWMFGDMDDVEVARRNPFRWSANEGLEAMIAEMQGLSDGEKQRKVIVKVFKEEYEFSNIEEVLHAVSPSVLHCWGDLSSEQYLNPFRWSGNESLEDAYEDMQLLNEENLARPVILREGGNERRYASVTECLTQLEQLVGGAGKWCVENSWQIALKGEENIFEGRVPLLQTGSVKKAVDDLTAGTLKCPAGLAVMWSDSRQAYFVLFRSDKKHRVRAKFSSAAAMRNFEG